MDMDMTLGDHRSIVALFNAFDSVTVLPAQRPPMMDALTFSIFISSKNCQLMFLLRGQCVSEGHGNFSDSNDNI
jgi:hypothetical protein